jgi:hypothetical protein
MILLLLLLLLRRRLTLYLCLSLYFFCFLSDGRSTMHAVQYAADAAANARLCMNSHAPQSADVAAQQSSRVAE